METSCPACRRPRAGGDECPHCGLIYGRWKGRATPPRRPHCLSLAERERLFSAIATAIEAGLPLRHFLDTAGRTLSPALADAMRTDGAAGLPLSSTLASLRLLTAAELAFLRAGEERGGLPASLRLLAQRAADRRRERNRLLLALAYPTALLIAACVLVPLPLAFRDGLAAWASRALPPLGLLATAAVAALVVIPRSPPDAPIRQLLRNLGLALPGTSRMIREGAIATLLDVLGTSLAAGLPARQALPLALEAAPHPAFRSDEPLRRLDAGASLVEAVAAPGLLPPATLAQIAQGEQTGTLDRVLPALAADHASQSRRAALAVIVVTGLAAGAGALGLVAWSVVEGWVSYFRQLEKVVP